MGDVTKKLITQLYQKMEQGASNSCKSFKQRRNGI